MAWLEKCYNNPSSHIISYEDLHKDTNDVISSLICSITGHQIRIDKIDAATKSGCFENMRMVEQSGLGAAMYPDLRLSPTDALSEDTYKTLRGKLEGYLDYLTEAEIKYANFVLLKHDYFEKFDNMSNSSSGV